MLQCLLRCKKSEVIGNNLDYLFYIIDVISKIQLNDKIYIKNDIIYICSSMYRYFIYEENHKNALFINNIYNKLFAYINELINEAIQIELNDKKYKINLFIENLFYSLDGLQNFKNNCNDNIINITLDNILLETQNTIKYLVSIRNNTIIV